MAQAGLYVASSQFQYVPYTGIFTRILGNDNLFKGLSTFAVEMSELRVILNMADKNSLILGDELCSGTEHDSAVSIFVSGLEMLHKKETCAIFATHLHEIVHYEEIKNMNKIEIKHLTVSYNKEKDMLIYDRKLKDGPGESMYGLEVCKSLHLPDEFLENASRIRRKYKKEEQGVLSNKQSHFNSKKIMGICELCKINIGEEVHHLQHQENANKNNMIKSFHKNHLANLLTLCEDCHQNIHKNKTQHKKVKTTKGIKIMEIE
jgi:DNA mismatch repair protein MutS